MAQTKVKYTELSDTLLSGWIPAGETWTYASVDDPTGVITVPTDATTKYSVGMRISFVNATNTIYGIITAVTSTTITFLHEIDPTDSLALTLMADSAITVPKYSTQKAPFGFPLSPSKWTVELVDANTRIQVSAIIGTWYNLNSNQLAVPIGAWELGYSSILYSAGASSVDEGASSTISTSASAESHTAYKKSIRTSGASSTIRFGCPVSKSKSIELSSKTTFYLLARKNQGTNSVALQDYSILKAVCAYL